MFIVADLVSLIALLLSSDLLKSQLDRYLREL